MSAYIDENGRHILPFDYIETTNNDDCIKSFIAIYEKIDLAPIRRLATELYDNGIISALRKDFFDTVLAVRYELVMKGLYDRIKETGMRNCADSKGMTP